MAGFVAACSGINWCFDEEFVVGAGVGDLSFDICADHTFTWIDVFAGVGAAVGKSKRTDFTVSRLSLA